MPAASGSDPVRVARDTVVRSLPILRPRGRRSWLRFLLPIAVGLLGTVIGSIWLHTRIQGWERAGDDVVSQHLLAIIAATVFTSAFVTALGMLQTSIGGDEALLLLPLPLSPSQRLRIAVVRTVGDARSILTLVTAAVAALTIALSHPWWGGVFVMALPIGFVIGSIVAIHGVGLWTNGSWYARGALLLIVMAVLGAQLLMRWTGETPVLDARIAAAMALVLVAAGAFAMTGRRATALGRTYVRAVQLASIPTATPNVRQVAGVTLLADRLRRRRNPASAMIVKDLLVQSRDWFYSLRLVVTIGALPLFLYVRKLDLLDGWTPLELAACLAAFLTIYSLLDSAPSPIGSEGERLSLWHLAPTRPGALLRAKLVTHLMPLVLQGTVIVALIGIWIGLPPGDIVAATTLTTLVVCGPVTFIVLGSSFDLRLDVPLESGLPTTMHEHVPITSQRLWLLNLGLLITGLMVVIVWQLPLAGAALALGIVDVLIVVIAWRAASRHLLRLV